jgi:hypothetical protein
MNVINEINIPKTMPEFENAQGMVNRLEPTMVFHTLKIVEIEECLLSPVLPAPV